MRSAQTDDAQLRISRLERLPLEQLEPLIAAAAREGWRHLGRLRDEWISGANRFDRPGEGLYLGAIEDRAVAVCGLNVDPYAGDPRVGRLRRLYVAGAHRGHGVGRALVHHAIGEAGRTFAEVRLRTHDAGADAFYRALGFAQVSDVEGCTHALQLCL